MRAAARPLGRFLIVFALYIAAVGLVLLGIHARTAASDADAFWQAFVALVVIGGVAAWLLVLAQESRRVAQEETRRQTGLLMSEIRAHRRTDAALQRAKEVAEGASQAKSHFVTNINHELRSPLNAILGYAQLLERDPGSLERRPDALRIIRRSGEHLAALVEGLLDISRIEAKRIDIYRDEVALPEFLSQLVDMFRLQAEDKGIGFVFEAPYPLPARVHTDEHRLRQILINLLSNAIKFTARGSVMLRVAWRSEIAEIDVIDTGIGIAASDLERIFEPLQRVKEARSQIAPGMGLGLTITKVLTQIMGGDISVSSAPGQGSRFRVRMMLSRSQAAADAPLGERRITGYSGLRRTVMVADDDPVHRGLVADLLTPLGFAVKEAQDGPHCLELAASGACDLFLIDLSMPGMTGWALAAALRETHALAPIIIISADGQELRQPPPDALHHDDVLAKPIDVDGLLARIARLLHLQWLAPEPAGETGREAAQALNAAQLDRLRELAAIGYVSGLRAELDVLDREAPAGRAQVAHLRGLLAEYRLEAFLSALDAASGGRAVKRRDTVLVVDDVPGTLGLLNEALEAAGYTVLLAQSAPFALTIIERIIPDVILIDALMPEMDGFELCRIMKRNMALLGVPIIFMTGLTESEHVVRGFEAGGVDYVTKPVAPNEVIARIGVHLVNARRTRGAQMALDAAGRFLFGATPDGRVLWSTPQATALLRRAAGDEADDPTAELRAWPEDWRIAPADLAPGRCVATLTLDRQTLELHFVGQFSPDEMLLRVVAAETSSLETLLRQRLGLTAREAEVLLWISRGKSNRDIGDILGMKPSTVTKHLEQIYIKLGVENRASAAAIAVRAASAE